MHGAHPSLSLSRDLVLIGGGHSHALVLRRWGMRPLPGARLTLINPGPAAPYSGMLPGYVAGHYGRDDLDIDLVRLARFAGARLVIGAAEAIDLDRGYIHLPGRPPIGFDICSLDVGVTSAMPALPGFDRFAVPAKPLGPFASAWQDFRAQAGSSAAVIGAGVAGAELALAMAHARPGGRIHLIDRSAALAGTRPRTRARLLRALHQAGVTLIEHAEIGRIQEGAVLLQDGARIGADFITGAAGASPHPWLADTGLALTDGFVTVDRNLQSSDARVFAAGDCAHFAADPRPKAGVFAVRQAPVLHHNLVAALSGGAMRPYRPQHAYLKLISLGRRSAVADRPGLSLSGPVIWRWKDRIDQRFMDRFRSLSPMRLPAPPHPRAIDSSEHLSGEPMCGGCGAKVGRDALRDALGPASDPVRADITPLPGDDAAMLRVGNARQVISTDHLRAFVQDPVTMTRITAVHAMGDIWSMGAQPQAATLTVILPRQTTALQTRLLAEITSTARTTLREAGAELVGGHSTIGDELTIGFTVTGLCDADPITLAGARPGDALILTKPLGSGTLLAADMRLGVRGSRLVAALEIMERPLAADATILSGAHAMTDVTGFGLAGHVLNICEASGLGAVIEPDRIPLMPGAAELAKQGIRSTLFAQNRAAAPHIAGRGASGGDHTTSDLLFDPQTAGGLLAAVPSAKANGLVARLRTAGATDAAIIGRLEDGPAHISLG